MFDFFQQDTIHAPVSEVFDFFSKAENLERITPEFLEFRILTPLPIQMESGTLIDYKLKVHGIPIRWRTLITEWNPPFSFTDEQVKGPYRKWIHRHTFEAGTEPNSTIMKDHVQYSLWGGGLARFLIEKDIQSIFNHRRSEIRSQFPVLSR
jgi:ligand-binding SRPBCC domain-containing protein